MLIPRPRLNQVFKSRWMALLWAGAMLLSAYFTVEEVAGRQQAPAESSAAADSDAASAASQLQAILPADSASSAAPARSPWAPDTSTDTPAGR
ncbi:MAG TPA: hypothetical protein VFF98_05710 [Novosphingobium sp.]|nr:hypothetical protein [Novosphingobium sp.]HZV10933.1 hypothetical protein [Novosphingobium sp.]